MKPSAIPASFEDLTDILALQKVTFQSEAILYDDDKLPPLTETLADIQHDFYQKIILKIVIDSQIVASGRGSFENNIVHIERLSVHPDYQKRGLGTILIKTLENHFPNPHFFKLFTGFKSFSNLRWYKKLGYEVIGEKQYSEKLKLHFMMKKVANPLKIKVCGMRDTRNVIALTELPIDYMGFIFYEKSARYVSTIPDLTTFKKLPNLKKVGVFVNADLDFLLGKVREFGLNVIQLHGKETPQYIEELKTKYLKLNALGSKLKNFDDAFENNSSKLDALREEILINTAKLNAIGNELVVNPAKLIAIKNDVAMNLSRLNALKNELATNASKISAFKNELAINASKMEVWKAFSVDNSFDFNETKSFDGFADKFLFDTKTPLHGGSGQKFDWAILNQYEGQTPFFLSGGISAPDVEEIRAIEHPMFYGVDLNSKFEISPALKDVPMLKKFVEDLRF